MYYHISVYIFSDKDIILKSYMKLTLTLLFLREKCITLKKGENMKWPLVTGIFGQFLGMYTWACIKACLYFQNVLVSWFVVDFLTLQDKHNTHDHIDYCKLRLHFLKDIA
jgi:hypothetical protein